MFFISQKKLYNLLNIFNYLILNSNINYIKIIMEKTFESS